MKFKPFSHRDAARHGLRIVDGDVWIDVELGQIAKEINVRGVVAQVEIVNVDGVVRCRAGESKFAVESAV